MNDQLANHQIVTVALYLLGGDSIHVDSEDIAKKSDEIAPGRFVWKKYHDQIDIHNIRAFLFDAKKQKNGTLVTGSEKTGWKLTGDGIKWAKNAVKTLKLSELRKKRLGPHEKRQRDNERNRILALQAYEKLRLQGPDSLTTGDIATFFRIDDYLDARAKLQKIDSLLNLFSDDTELGPLLKTLADKYGEHPHD